MHHLARSRRLVGAASMVLALALGSLVPSVSQAADDEDGFKPIFDGKSLEGWDGNPDFWRVEDGAITGQTTAEKPTRGNTFIIWRSGELDDFELKLEYKIVGGNSGIQYRSFELPKQKWVVGGYQADIDSGDTYSGINYGEQFRGILAGRGQKTVIKRGDDDKVKVEAVGSVGESKEIQSKIKKEDWNSYHVTAKGFTFEHRINGVVTSICTDEDKKMRRSSGILALQLHAGPPMKVQFRNIRLKRTKLEDKKKVAFVAGPPSHGYGAHEHKAGCMLLAKALNEADAGVLATVYTGGWPKDPTALDNVDCIVMYCDGAGGHMVVPHLKEVAAKMSQGVGLVCIHFAVEVTKGEVGDSFLAWIGGYYELFYSVNPHWTAKFEKLPQHAICRGVKPFTINDEWYYHIRFREKPEEITPILTALPPDGTRRKEKSPRGGNPEVFARRGLPEHVAWARERPDGGRGFGFTGGHVHWNWANPNFRKMILNAIAWCAKAEVPEGGLPTKVVSLEEIEANQDEPPPKNFDREAMREQINKWNE
jgi:type 1 glutamine amidotransferase